MSTANDVKRGSIGAGAQGISRSPLHVAFAVTLASFCAFYAETFTSLISTWAATGRYQYAFLIFPVSAVLIWLRRDTLRRLTAVPKLSGLVLLGGLCLLWLAGMAAHINLVTQFSVIAAVPCLVLTFYGTAITRALLFPLAYLFFALPFGNFLVGPLQHITARLSVAVLQWTTIPVFVDGHLIMTPAGTWHVAEACSGVSFFFATTAFGVLYAHLFYQSWLRRIVFVACALIAPIVANGLRVFFTILIGEYFGMQYATGTDHMIFGWQFFGTVIVLLFLGGWPWHEAEAAFPASQTAAVGRQPASIMKSLAVMVAGLSVLAAAPLWFHATAAASASGGPVQVLALPAVLGGLPRTGVLGAESGPGTVFRNPDRYARLRYGGAARLVLVNLAAYDGASEEGGELLTHGNRVFDSSNWTAVAGYGGPGLAAPAGFEALYLVRRNGHKHWLVWYAFGVAGHVTGSEARVKLWQAWHRLLGRPGQAHVVTLATRVTDGNDAAAAERLARVAQDLVPWLGQETWSKGGTRNAG